MNRAARVFHDNARFSEIAFHAQLSELSLQSTDTEAVFIVCHGAEQEILAILDFEYQIRKVPDSHYKMRDLRHLADSGGIVVLLAMCPRKVRVPACVVETIGISYNVQRVEPHSRCDRDGLRRRLT